MYLFSWFFRHYYNYYLIRTYIHKQNTMNICRCRNSESTLLTITNLSLKSNPPFCQLLSTIHPKTRTPISSKRHTANTLLSRRVGVAKATEKDFSAPTSFRPAESERRRKPGERDKPRRSSVPELPCYCFQNSRFCPATAADARLKFFFRDDGDIVGESGSE